MIGGALTMPANAKLASVERTAAEEHEEIHDEDVDEDIDADRDERVRYRVS